MTPEDSALPEDAAPAHATGLPDPGTGLPAHETGLRVLRQEQEGLAALAASMDGNLGAEFDQAIALIEACTGRIIVTGMGKSGHIARKIAATLSSTGTPAFFVHPGEAAHGDLGMIAARDCVLALSLSGETRELDAILNHVRRTGSRLVSITGNTGGVLGTHAHVAMCLPPLREACPNGLAPTTSTLMMLALGDALAVALLHRKGFGPGDFRLLHPGGQLGQRLMLVSDLMHRGETMPLVAGEVPMAEAVLEMTRKGFGCAGVLTAEGVLEGMLTDGDLRRMMGPGLLEARARDIMSRHPHTIGEDQLVVDALRQMHDRRITSLFVCDREGRPAGFVHLHDCLRVR